MEPLYPWHLLAPDIALANGLDQDAETKIATELSRAIQTGTVQCWKKDGEPIRGSHPFDQHGVCLPHITKEEGNAWLQRRRYLFKWEPNELAKERTSSSTEVSTVDYSKLATRDQLIRAFGAFTGMDHSWFKNITDAPKLLAARKVRGHGQRSHTTEPYFCPYEIMKWQVDPKKKKGKPMSEGTGWRILKNHFPKAYDAFSLDIDSPD